MDRPVTWESMVEQYPDKWLAIKDAQLDGPDIISGIIYAVMTDDEIIDYEDQHGDEGLIFRRTKGGVSNGPIRANFVIETT